MKLLSALALALFLFTSAATVSAAEAPGAPGADELPGSAERPPELDRLLAEIMGGAAAGPPPAAPPPAPPLPQFDPAVAAAEYVETGEPPILATPAGRVYPWGHGIPTVTCMPLRACDLAFEVGESVTGWALGDSERWQTQALVEGLDAKARHHLLLKPVDYDLASNLIVVTDRRTYHVQLRSPAEEAARDADPPVDFDAQVAWWYPDAWVRRVAAERVAAADVAAATAARHAAAVEIDRPLPLPERLSFDYELERPWRRSRRLSWTPVTVFDDGRKVYIRLPARARRGELPVLLGVLEDGSTYPLDARLEGDWLIVPTLFERATFVLGAGERRRTLDLVAPAGGDA